MNHSLGYCPHCKQDTISLPAPADGTCSECFCHQMKPCNECDHFVQDVVENDIVKRLSFCAGDPSGSAHDWRDARKCDSMCGAGGKWANFSENA